MTVTYVITRESKGFQISVLVLHAPLMPRVNAHL